MERITVKHLYIHIPFCKKKCPYCDFYSIIPKKKNIKDEYLKSIIKELNYYKNILNFKLETIYFGGGSPLLIGTENLETLLKQLTIPPKTEITIELNPEHIENDGKTIEKLNKIGFNRFSIGVQTINKQILKDITRSYNLEKLVKNIEKIKKKKIKLSLDFMFGLPKQSIKDLSEDLNFCIKNKIKHLSFYLFTVPKTKYSLPNEEIITKMFKLINNRLKKENYIHYEVSNFAKKSNFSKHNLAYWKRKSYLGLGVSAHSFFKEKEMRFWKNKNIEEYVKNPLKTEEEIINKNQKNREKIMLGLRLLNQGVSKRLIKDKDKIKLLKANNLLKEEKRKIKVNEQKTYLIDSIIEELI